MELLDNLELAHSVLGEQSLSNTQRVILACIANDEVVGGETVTELMSEFYAI